MRIANPEPEAVLQSQRGGNSIKFTSIIILKKQPKQQQQQQQHANGGRNDLLVCRNDEQTDSKDASQACWLLDTDENNEFVVCPGIERIRIDRIV